jgi:2'-5' RNA ligase
MRIFIALLLNKSVHKVLDSVKEKLIEKDVEGRYVRNDLWHITLHYIGETSADELKKIKQSLRQIDLSPFVIKTSQLDYFGKNRAKKIVHLGVELNQDLKTCHRLVIDHLSILNKTIEDDIYRPHITLIRKADVDVETLESIKVKPITMTVEAIHIMESKRMNHQLVYESLDMIKLKNS